MQLTLKLDKRIVLTLREACISVIHACDDALGQERTLLNRRERRKMINAMITDERVQYTVLERPE